MRWRTVVAVALMSAVVVACGVPGDDGPRHLDFEGFGSGAVTPTSAPASDTIGGNGVAAFVSVVRDQRLVVVTRELPEGSTVSDVLALLLDGPTPAEQRAEVRSAVPSGTRLDVSAVGPDVVRVDVSAELAALGGEEEILAIGQIVRTVTAFTGARGVAFELEGDDVDVPTANGTLADIVTAEDYAPLAEP